MTRETRLAPIQLTRVSPEEASLARVALDPAALAIAREIIDQIRAEGLPALRSIAQRLGDLEPVSPLIIERPALRSALDRLPREQVRALEAAHDRIATFARAQRDALRAIEIPVPGGVAGHRVVPVDAAGCYAPGGRFPLPSSVLMTVATARAAGVPTVIAASPRPTDATLAAAAIADADMLLAVGGAQAIAALSLGVGVPRCDLIVGPGNKFVTAAKHLASAWCAIDMLAGPSEVLILADDSADPARIAALIAADMLAQCEHDPDAAAILITTHEPLIPAVEAHLTRQLETLPTAAIARAALTNSRAIHVPTLDAALAASDRLAPEHLEIMTRDPMAALARLRHFGAAFVGSSCAEVLGDYGIGPNHVLPTGGSAAHAAGLSALTFLRLRPYVRIDAPTLAPWRDTITLARVEGLEAHARAAEARQGPTTGSHDPTPR